MTSILERLKSPTPIDLVRKRKVCKNPPIGKKKSSGVRGVNDLKSISPSQRQRVKEFFDQCLQVSNNKLFRIGCREELSIRKKVITNHIKSIKHKQGKNRLATKSAKEKPLLKP